MRKLLFAALAVFAFANVNAQEFGVTAGFDSAVFSVSNSAVGGTSVAVDGKSGFFIGGFAELGLSDSFNLRGDVIYSAVSDFAQVRIPITVGYGFAEKWNVYAGPSAHIVLEDLEGVNSFFIGLDARISFDITEQFLVQAGYNLGVTDAFDNDFFNWKANSFNIGVGYRFGQ